ncbi:hypothetical protein BWD42_20630 [Sphingobacterium sp. CZ-UAM]|uniref:thioredoxin family protein n=1 Tax=Sphingobacterium sp. CZ-UAM TaxID=1933868 RepID=UPI000985076D|nr:thioredoxin family protein [Sphingobacterium sp. CZ-UAM]OOG16633.1 hypothetical protein BWD42_20630 [Sphingobacterium sp. CZ-UAM]
MKKLIFYIIIAYYGIFFSNVAIAQEKIFQGSYAECQAQAKKENKLILIDLYFVGCMPCAEMDKQVFPDPAVTKELNDNYILYKTDVMKEEDGKKIARKYAAPGFPTYVIVSPEGKTIMTESGFFGVDRFVPLLKEAVQRNKSAQYLAFNNTLDNSYPAAYSERFIKTGEKHDFAELEGYLEQQKDLFNETAFLANSVTYFAKYNNWAYDNLPKLIKLYGGNLLRNKISTIAKAKSKQYGTAQQLDSLTTMLAYIRPTFNDKLWEVFLPGFVASYYAGSQNATTYFALIDQYQLYPTWDERSNAFGQVIIDQSKNPTILKSIRAEYLAAEQRKKLDQVDSYRLTLLHYYLKDFDQASKEMEKLSKSDSTSPFLAINKKDLQVLREAIKRKDANLFKAKDIKKIIPFKLS